MLSCRALVATGANRMTRLLGFVHAWPCCSGIKPDVLWWPLPHVARRV